MLVNVKKSYKRLTLPKISLKMTVLLMLIRILLAKTFILANVLVFLTGTSFAASSAVVFMYHRFGETQYPSTNIRLDQFKAHIKTLLTGGFAVKHLDHITAQLLQDRNLPDKTVGLSIDDAYLSVYRNAWPLLRSANLPFTLFVATDAIDKKLPGYMNWDQIRELYQWGARIGSQTASHPHMPLLSPQKMAKELEKSNNRFKAELGFVPSMIAYPYGEYSLAVKRAVQKAGFRIGFGQHSGVIHSQDDFFYLPRFAFNETFGGVERVRLAADALPLRVRDITPSDPFLSADSNPPAFGFTVTGGAMKKLDQLNCYAPNGRRLRIERLGESRVEIRMAKKFPAGRSRINCTLPEKVGRWRWFGRQFFVSREGSP